MGCGKDYICNNMIIPILRGKNKNYLQVAFADQIKINLMTKKNIAFEDVYIDKTHETRKLLQTEGTENGRDCLDENIWINYLHNWLTLYESRGVEYFICTDVRFLNEVEYIKKYGGILIKIDAPKRNLKRLLSESRGDNKIMESIMKHKSECDLDGLSDDSFDIIINNDTNDDMNYVIQDFHELLEFK